MSEFITIVPSDVIENSILLVRGEKVLLDADLARLYGVETKVLLQAVKRNIARFPGDFMFKLSYQEVRNLKARLLSLNSQPPKNTKQKQENDFENKNSRSFQHITSLRSQIVTSKREHIVITEFSSSAIYSLLEKGGRRTLPYLFTEQGIAMLSSVLNTPRAVAVNIEIIRTFVRLRQMIASHAELSEKLEKLEANYDGQFRIVFDAIRELMTPLPTKKKKPIGFATK